MHGLERSGDLSVNRHGKMDIFAFCLSIERLKAQGYLNSQIEENVFPATSRHSLCIFVLLGPACAVLRRWADRQYPGFLTVNQKEQKRFQHR
jgi:hypothetical protein